MPRDAMSNPATSSKLDEQRTEQSRLQLAEGGFADDLTSDLLVEHPDVFGARTLRTLAKTEFNVIALIDPGTIQG